ncbi:MAG: acyl-CoA thioester hydrolase [Psychroserpens sp.]|jgi:acyl-CoA thioester hydrolase
MVPFEKDIYVQQEDLDDLNHVNNVRYVQWIQDISKEHWQEKAPESLKEGIIWVVLNHNISYKSAAKLNDHIKIRTYIAKTKGAISTRIVEMFDAVTNVPIVHAKTEWCMLNATTFKPMRVSEEIQNIFI